MERERAPNPSQIINPSSELTAGEKRTRPVSPLIGEGGLITSDSGGRRDQVRGVSDDICD